MPFFALSKSSYPPVMMTKVATIHYLTQKRNTQSISFKVSVLKTPIELM